MRIKLTLLFTLWSYVLAGQTTDSKEKEPIHFVLSPGVSYQKEFLGELNFYFAKISDDVCNGCAVWGPRLGVETNFSRTNFIIAPKIGYELAGMVFCFRGNVVCYFHEAQTDLRLLPEIGITLICMVNITYGYGFSILDDRIPDIGKSKLTLTLNLARYWMTE